VAIKNETTVKRVAALVAEPTAFFLKKITVGNNNPMIAKARTLAYQVFLLVKAADEKRKLAR